MKRRGKTLRRILRQFKRRPFKGANAYEWQIGPVVFQVYHLKSTLDYRKRKGYKVIRFGVWRDPNWWKWA